MTTVYLARGKGHRLEQGHPWIFKGEISRIDGETPLGGAVIVRDSRGKFIGHGTYSPQSQIAVRLWSLLEESPINASLIDERIKLAVAYRDLLGRGKVCRLVFGEADFMPGLVVDRYDDVLVLQTLSAGADARKDEIVAGLKKRLKPKGIYERNEVPIRTQEGLPLQSGFIGPSFETSRVVSLNGFKFKVDVASGQKTGFFLDQADNALSLKNLAEGARVLDCFCHTGFFSVHAGGYEAESVLGLDASAEAVELATQNAKLNGLEQVKFEKADIFDALPAMVREKRDFDVVVLDPPAFAKNRGAIEGALKGYREINRRALQLLVPGGFLLTFSCSRFITPDLLAQAVMEASRDAKRRLRQVAYLNQAPDHPIVWGIDETYYLKGFVLQVL